MPAISAAYAFDVEKSQRLKVRAMKIGVIANSAEGVAALGAKVSGIGELTNTNAIQYD